MCVSEITNNYMNEVKVDLLRLYQIIIKSKSNSFTNKLSTELYYVVKKIRDLSVIFHYKELFEISSFIYKKIKIDKLEYFIKSEDKNIIFCGIIILIKHIEDLERNRL